MRERRNYCQTSIDCSKNYPYLQREVATMQGKIMSNSIMREKSVCPGQREVWTDCNTVSSTSQEKGRTASSTSQGEVRTASSTSLGRRNDSFQLCSGRRKENFQRKPGRRKRIRPLIYRKKESLLPPQLKEQEGQVYSTNLRRKDSLQHNSGRWKDSF